MSEEVLPEASGAGTVVLDIGGDIGALAVATAAGLLGAELEIRAVGTEWAGEHVAVRERKLPGETVYAALFPSLREGRYDVRVRHGDAAGPVLAVHVTGAQVSYATFPDI